MSAQETFWWHTGPNICHWRRTDALAFFQVLIILASCVLYTHLSLIIKQRLPTSDMKHMICFLLYLAVDLSRCQHYQEVELYKTITIGLKLQRIFINIQIF